MLGGDGLEYSHSLAQRLEGTGSWQEGEREVGVFMTVLHEVQLEDGFVTLDTIRLVLLAGSALSHLLLVTQESVDVDAELPLPGQVEVTILQILLFFISTSLLILLHSFITAQLNIRYREVVESIARGLFTVLRFISWLAIGIEGSRRIVVGGEGSGVLTLISVQFFGSLGGV